MEVKVFSKELIKPSKPTPPHLRIFKLSLLDQLIPSPYAPIVFFYSNNDTETTTHRKLSVLKTSLSNTLTSFYPLAGTLRDDLSIECNDTGANFIETRVNCCLDDFLTKPDLLLVEKLLPCEPMLKESDFVTNIQVNVFECSGIAVGLCISHKIIDGAALSGFLKSWTTAAVGGKVAKPSFVANSLFPTDNIWLQDCSMEMWRSLFKIGKSKTRRFIFDSSAISALKAKVSDSITSPTTIETISAFIWKSAISAFKAKNNQNRPSLLTHLVNLRTRMDPPLSSKPSTGNLLWLASAYQNQSDQNTMCNLLSKVRAAISVFDSDFVSKLTGNEGTSIMSESLKRTGDLGSGNVDYLGFSSWCKLGYYEIDFGWGKPIWVSSVGLSGLLVLNLVILVETRAGDGIEAWISLDEQEMNFLVSDHEFVKLALVDPSPIHVGCEVKRLDKVHKLSYYTRTCSDSVLSCS